MDSAAKGSAVDIHIPELGELSSDGAEGFSLRVLGLRRRSLFPQGDKLRVHLLMRPTALAGLRSNLPVAEW